jgi:hypothetical protein
MNAHTGRHGARSPLVPAADLARHGPTAPPARPTAPELNALLGLLTRPRHGPRTVAVGHSRDAVCRAAAHAFTAAWEEAGGTVVATVDWPESAASWLRPAGRLTAGAPDAWVFAATVTGFAQLARRLRHSTDWDPRRSHAFAALADPHLPALAGPPTVDGLSGATADGGTWQLRGHALITLPPV